MGLPVIDHSGLYNCLAERVVVDFLFDGTGEGICSMIVSWREWWRQIFTEDRDFKLVYDSSPESLDPL